MNTAHALADDHKFRVYQYWNGGDFYNTELTITYPDGRSVYRVIDPDAPKRWTASVRIDEAKRLVTIGTRTISW